jgi:hypothetical protein
MARPKLSNLQRVAEELLESLTVLQLAEVAEQLSKPQPHFEHMAHLSRCQRNALKLLLETNEHHHVKLFFSVHIQQTVTTRTVVSGKWLFVETK